MYGIGFSMREIIERYRRHTADVQSENPSVEQEQDMQVMLSFNLCLPTSIHCIENTETKAYLILQHLQHETECLAKKIDYLEASKRRLLGEDLGACAMEELQQIEQQLERSVNIIRARKMEVYAEQIKRLRDKEESLKAENAVLWDKYNGLQPQQVSNEGNEKESAEGSEKSDVETELFIGLPESRAKPVLSNESLKLQLKFWIHMYIITAFGKSRVAVEIFCGSAVALLALQVRYAEFFCSQQQSLLLHLQTEVYDLGVKAFLDNVTLNSHVPSPRGSLSSHIVRIPVAETWNQQPIQGTEKRPEPLSFYSFKLQNAEEILCYPDISMVKLEGSNGRIREEFKVMSTDDSSSETLVFSCLFTSSRWRSCLSA
nr:MADS-box protein SOC1-like [Ipomoea batatas]